MKHGIRVWLDDVREAPAGWTRAKTAAEAIALLEAGGVTGLSLDHDLGDEATCGNGHDVLVWLEERVALAGFAPPAVAIHSANVVGRERMQRAIESIERLQRAARTERVRQAFLERDAPRRRREEELLRQIKARLPDLEELLADTNDVEDLVYRFYHQSFKVYGAQNCTERIVAALRALLPDASMNEWFMQIVAEGTGRQFGLEDNEKWLAVTRPQLEALFHARYFLRRICEYGRELDEPPTVMPSGWAAVLYLYGLR